jgi:excisionase family DNA binding protein
MADMLSVSEIANELGLSERRVRALLKAGQLRGERVGRSWLVSRHAVEQFRRRPRQRGRQLNARNAWALLALLAGEKPHSVRPDALSRLRRYARDPNWLLNVIAHSEPRSDVFSLWLRNEDLPKLAEYPLIHSGLSAEHALSYMDLIRRREEPLDVYASSAVVRQIVGRFAPEENVDDPNVILRVPKHALPSSEGGEAPRSVVAADLLDHEDARVRRAGENALRELALAR